MTESFRTIFTCTRCLKTRTELSSTWGSQIQESRSEICAVCKAKEANASTVREAFAQTVKLQRRSLHEWLSTFMQDGQQLKVVYLRNGDIALMHENGVHCTFVTKDQ